jgi:hypothetical protein
MSRKPLQTASSSITGHQDGDEVPNVIMDGISHSLKIKVDFFFSLFFFLS